MPYKRRKRVIKRQNKEIERIKNILYNAISLLVDETFEQYDDSEEWFTMIQNEIGCTKEELEYYGIIITIDGELSLK